MATENDLSIAFVIVIIGVLVVVIFVLIVVILYKRKHPRQHHRQLEVNPIEGKNDLMKVQRTKLFTTNTIYIDPSTYNKVDEAVNEYTVELNRNSVKMDHLVGGGEFANVFKGIFKTESGNCDVAIKVLKSGSSDQERNDFLIEAANLGQFSDPNVVCIQGVILKDHPNLIILEFMENGSLDKYLVKNDGKLNMKTCLGMSRDVASGMKYLSQRGYIHRDLAARNVLVNNKTVCKISDFGMSRKLLKTDCAYYNKDGKIPIKWTAPESIEYKKYTTASDVWSYGILMWEIFSFGKKPYKDFTNNLVIEKVYEGYRLPSPMGCPKLIHNLMLQCWHNDRTMRPRFNVLLEQIQDWLTKPPLFTIVKNRSTEDKLRHVDNNNNSSHYEIDPRTVAYDKLSSNTKTKAFKPELNSQNKFDPLTVEYEELPSSSNTKTKAFTPELNSQDKVDPLTVEYEDLSSSSNTKTKAITPELNSQNKVGPLTVEYEELPSNTKTKEFTSELNSQNKFDPLTVEYEELPSNTKAKGFTPEIHSELKINPQTNKYKELHRIQRQMNLHRK